jgi:hypothetical protein
MKKKPNTNAGIKKDNLTEVEIEHSVKNCVEYFQNIITLSNYIINNENTFEGKTEKFREAETFFKVNMELIIFILTTIYDAPMHYAIEGNSELKPITVGTSLEMLNENLKDLNAILKMQTKEFPRFLKEKSIH